MARKLSILVVDDDDLYRDVLALRLLSLGHTVASVSSGSEALDLLAKVDGALDLMITDGDMPTMSGVDLTKRAKNFNPNLVVFMNSGNPDLEEAFLDAGGIGFFSKSDAKKLIQGLAELQEFGD